MMQCSQSISLPAAFVQRPSGKYAVKRVLTAEEIIQQARSILSQQFTQKIVLSNTKATKDFFVSRLFGLDHEVFCVAFLDSMNHVIVCENLFRGTVNQAPVYPREVAKRALEVGAISVLLAHNHPSGSSQPSKADKDITFLLEKSLNVFGIRVLDHVIVCGMDGMSFTEQGLLGGLGSSSDMYQFTEGHVAHSST